MDELDIYSANDEASVTVTTIEPPAADITVAADIINGLDEVELFQHNDVIGGEVFTYTAVVTNNGPDEAKKAVLTGTLPVEMTLEDSEIEMTIEGSEVDLGSCTGTSNIT